MTLLELTAIGACALLSALVTGLVRRYALAHDVVDVPNERSSHGAPTPRGGGIAIVLVTTAALGVLAWRTLVRPELFWGVGIGGLAVALVGLADDHRSLSAAARLAVHFAAALWVLVWLGGLPPLRVGDTLVSLGLAGYLLGALGIVWTVNLFNFMDGIDGIAASEAVFVAVGGALLSVSLAGNTGIVCAALAFAAACAGFLVWNWPPAGIFLGDVGSGYMGYVIVALAVAAARDNPVALWVWLILGGSFFTDATVTLVRRTLRHERVHEAHRSHAYQWLARRWRNHASVTLAVLLVNLAWLLPCATWATRFPRYADACVIVALGPLAVVVAALGSGRKDCS